MSLRLSQHESLLVIVDMQEKLMPAMQDGEAAQARAVILLRAAALLHIPVVITEQYKKGLGETVGPVRAAAGPTARVFGKMHFSAYADLDIRAALTEDDGRRQIVIAGVESHVCVLQTALDLQAAGRHVSVVADAVASRRAESKRLGLARAAASGAQIVEAEMCLFEWLDTASHPEFKALSALIK